MLKLTSYIPAIVCFVVAAAPAALADSPLTSTPFASAYQDVRVVRYAGNNGLDRKIFEALSDPDVPNDVRAAIVNQIGWSNEPQQNAKLYLDYIARSRKTDPSRLKLSTLTAEESMALGYLLAMDNRFSPMSPIGGRGQVQQANAISLMNDAVRKAPDDFSVALIRGLIQANIDLTENSDNWCLVYQDVNQVVEDFPGDYNMRTEAIDIIMEYMNSYQSYCNSR
ncbi:MAG TPA: hypothetical protein DD000_09065 [Cyanobacteria bacterium UBA11166]|nr:hypothetical protein [Cyanobacteria bacterium UBA11166]HBS68655.1 hypothetical protein [Cyanobacteria bacterium UBA11153]